MKYLIIITTIAFLYCTSCNNSKQKVNDEDLFFYTSCQTRYNHFPRDTFSRENIRFHRQGDSLVKSLDFKLNNKTHHLRMFTTIFNNNIGTDGGGIFYELDSIGIIYSKNDYSCFYHRLRSTNEEINHSIDVALENIIAYPSLQNINQLLPKEETINYLEPISK